MTQRKTLAVLLTVVAVTVVGYLAYSNSGARVRNPSVDDQPTILRKVSLRLPIPVADTAFAPYYIALDRGYFAKHGLDVKLEPGSPELNPVKMVSQGTNVFGVIGGPELLLTARSKEAPIVAISLLHKDSDFVVLLSLKESGLTEAEQLAGKKVGFFYGHISTDILRMLFSKLSISVTEVDVGFDYSQLLTGKVDAQWAFRTTAGLTLPDKGVTLNVISPAEKGVHTDGHMLITNEKTIRENPELVQALVSAYLEATAYLLEHPDQGLEATVRRDSNFSTSVGERQLEIYSAAIRRNERVGWIKLEDLERSQEQMIASGLLASKLDLDKAFAPQFVEHFYEGASSH